MDLMDFDQPTLYYDDPVAPEVERLLGAAAASYGEDEAEASLLRAYFLAPEQLVVLVALYRYYFYQHRLDDALAVAERSMQLSGRHLGLPADWQRLDEARLGSTAANSFGLLRFYLLALKAASVVLLRLGRTEESRARLIKLAGLDSRDQLGAGKLLEVVDEFQAPPEAAETHPELTLVAA